MLITESELDTLLQDSAIVAFALVGRPAKPGDALTHSINGTTTQVNIADIYFFRRHFPEAQINLELYKDQLALPVGAIAGQVRSSAKPVLSTPRTNTIS